MGKLIDLTGQRFGRLTVLHQAASRKAPDGRTLVYWHCVCDCGNEKDIYASRLRKGESLSCGCYNRDHQAELHKTHGDHGSRLYTIWCGMRQRCGNPHKKAYNDYGGRGITVCEEWRNSFEAFRDWALASGYRDDLTIDRIDVNGDYCPENCRWVTQKEQCVNRRNNVHITFRGETRTLKEWCEHLDMPYATVHFRIKYLGWDIEKALSTPV